jgi:hypothetical protein
MFKNLDACFYLVFTIMLALIVDPETGAEAYAYQS